MVLLTCILVKISDLVPGIFLPSIKAYFHVAESQGRPRFQKIIFEDFMIMGST